MGDLRRFVDVFLRRWWLWPLICAVFVVGGYLISAGQTPVYRATATIMVGEFLHADSLSRTDVQTSEIIARTYADMAVRQPVLQKAAEALALPGPWQDLRRSVSVDQPSGTQLLEVSALGSSKRAAVEIADAVADQLVALNPNAKSDPQAEEDRSFVGARAEVLRQRIEETQGELDTMDQEMASGADPQRFAELQGSARVLQSLIGSWESTYIQMLGYLDSATSSRNATSIIEQAQASSTPLRPRPLLSAVVGGLIGLLACGAVIAVLGLRDVTLRRGADVGAWLGVAVLGTVGRIAGRGGRWRLLPAQDDDSPAAEAYRVVRSNIEYRSGGSAVQVIAVTSSLSGEGKSLTAANLAIVSARSGSRTILVDADLRRPSQAALFGLNNGRGLAEALRAPHGALAELLVPSGVAGLAVLVSGAAARNPAELLVSQSMRELIGELRAMADVVIIDTPPVLGLSDSAAIANRSDAVVFVVDAGRTKVSPAAEAIAELGTAGANIVGVVVNRGDPGYVGYYAPRAAAAPRAVSPRRGQGVVGDGI